MAYCYNWTFKNNQITNNYFIGIGTNNLKDSLIDGNNISLNTMDGAEFGSNSDNNTIRNNLFYDNDDYGLQITSGCDSNLIYSNNFTLNNDNALDSGQFNKWNNSEIGNYWSDYTDVVGAGNDIDQDDDGIGDSIYNNNGITDYLPIWDDGNNGTKIYIDESRIVGGSMTWNFAVTRSWCTGSGTKEDPYIIEDLYIDAEDSGSCITVRATNAYFIIRNSKFIRCQTGGSYAGIVLFNAHNGTLINNNCSLNKNIGINLVSTSTNNLITQNYVANGDTYGIVTSSDCNNNNITYNTIEGNHNNGINIYHSDYCLVQGNEIRGTTHIYAINNFYGQNTTIRDNYCHDNYFL